MNGKRPEQKWKTNQSTKINLIGCDTIVNSPSYKLISIRTMTWKVVVIPGSSAESFLPIFEIQILEYIVVTTDISFSSLSCFLPSWQEPLMGAMLPSSLYFSSPDKGLICMLKLNLMMWKIWAWHYSATAFLFFIFSIE